MIMYESNSPTQLYFSTFLYCINPPRAIRLN